MVKSTAKGTCKLHIDDNKTNKLDGKTPLIGTIWLKHWEEVPFLHYVKQNLAQALNSDHE
ncbi:hypothetical protein ACP70R_001743 [Stipagrostis hirtigluma subsp. patula]